MGIISKDGNQSKYPKKLGYLTIGDGYSGIFETQVIDTCKFLSKLSGGPVKLIALISIRRFWENRTKIKQEYPDAIILPMAPKLENWRWNQITLSLLFSFFKGYSLICRNAIPTNVGIYLKRKGLLNEVIYDGRGVEYEQIVEYNVITNSKLAQEILECEKTAALQSDIQLAVSEALVEYWKEKFDFNNDNPLIIPCTFPLEAGKKIQNRISRQELGIKKEDLLFAYSGTVSGWQSFGKMFQFLEEHLIFYPNSKALLLTQITQEVKLLTEKFPNRVIQKWVTPEVLKNYLELADYGLLIREKSVTNWVASPIKFADYLSAGLKVIVNQNSIQQPISFIEENKICGVIYKGEPINSLKPIEKEERNQIKQLAEKNYTKSASKNLKLYQKLIEAC